MPPVEFAARRLPALLKEAGAAAWGIADCTDGVDAADTAAYTRWLERGCHAGMDYMARNRDVRTTPALLLPGARSMICCAFSYEPPQPGTVIAAYALGTDYHEVIRSRLGQVARAMEEATGCQTRVCVDTAPLRERYWASKCGVGFRGLNGHLIVPGKGSYILLGEILTTASLPSTPALDRDCGMCRRCVAACPAGALQPDGTVDARRCLSYLTIEHRGPFPEGTELHGRLYGCDACAMACPHNACATGSETVPELLRRPAVAALDAAAAAVMTQEQFSTIFTHSAIKRAKLAGLQRNACALAATQLGHLKKNE